MSIFIFGYLDISTSTFPAVSVLMCDVSLLQLRLLAIWTQLATLIDLLNRLRRWLLFLALLLPMNHLYSTQLPRTFCREKVSNMMAADRVHRNLVASMIPLSMCCHLNWRLYYCLQYSIMYLTDFDNNKIVLHSVPKKLYRARMNWSQWQNDGKERERESAWEQK